jgi:hypothetical protein
MPRLKNRLHERFAWLIAEGMERKAAFQKLMPHAADPAAQGCVLYKRRDVKVRIAEIQTEVNSRAVMALDEKRDMLRQMIEGTIPTKIIRKADGKVEAVFDRLQALVTDAKINGEFAPEKVEVNNSPISLTFEMYGRNDRIAPKAWLDAEFTEEPEPIAIEDSAKESMDLTDYESATLNETAPSLEDLVKESMLSGDYREGAGHQRVTQ